MEPKKSNIDLAQVAVRWPERLIKKRFGILLIVALIAWPFIGFIPQVESLVVNGLLLDEYSQLAYLTVTNVVAFFFAVSMMRVLNARNPGGKISPWLFGDGHAPWGWERVLVVAFLATLAPLILALFFGSELPRTGCCGVAIAMFTVGGSAAMAVAGLWGLGIVKSWIFGSREESANYFPFEARSQSGCKFLQPISAKFEEWLSKFGFDNTDLQFLIYLALMASVHHLVARIWETDSYWLTSAPSMLVLFLGLLFMTLAGLANWLDRWRIPSTLVLALVLTVLFAVRGSTRYLNVRTDESNNCFFYALSAIHAQENELLDSGGDITARRQLIADGTKTLDDAAWNAISQRMGNVSDAADEKGKTLVVVTCPGGGIHAAAWAACVLDQLSTEYVDFKDSICVISGVSGGSVGTLMFVGSRFQDEFVETVAYGNAQPSTEEVHDYLKKKSPALELSSRSALESIAFGATVDDLYNLVGIPGPGRGQRLEDDLNARLPPHVQSMTMGQWGDRSLAGKIPIVIFNSTDAVTGRRILFDTIPTPRRASSVGLIARPLNYRELLSTKDGAFDILPATAARTSATFPYVSPFTKPSHASEIGEHVALCDGGYADNEGIVTAVNWIEFLLTRWVERGTGERPFDRILLLRIEPTLVLDRNQPASSGGLAGMLRWLTGPAEAMAKVRTASQLERGNLEADLAALYLKVGSKKTSVQSKDESQLLGMTLYGSPAQHDAAIEFPEFDKRALSVQEIRNNWEKELDQFEASTKTSDAPPTTMVPKATFEDRDNSLESDPPVVVQTISFVDAQQVIPLNWKLSNRQKLGYLLAWKLCSSEGSPLRDTLDRYFHRREDHAEEPSN